MTWIPKKEMQGSRRTVAVAQAVPPPVKTHVQSLDLPVVMSVSRLPAPVYATLSEIAPHGAKIRSLVLLERGAEVEFDLGVGSGTPLTVVGRVVTRSSATAGARFEYLLTFTGMPTWQIDALARQVRELERRAAQSRAIEKQISALPTTDRDRRGCFRALSAIPTQFRPEGQPWAEGKVGDISSTGIRLRCPMKLGLGTNMSVRMTLPSSVLEIYPEETITIETTGNVTRSSGRADLRRPFEEMSLSGRVVTRFAPVRDEDVYGVAFIDIDGFLREEIARFTHAVQLSKIRSS